MQRRGVLIWFIGTLVKDTVEETLSKMPDAEADERCGVGRYERTERYMYIDLLSGDAIGYKALEA
jgi:hypothetical protein